MNRWSWQSRRIEDFVGLTFVEIKGMEQHEDEVTFVTDTGRTIIMYHEQDCCESVTLEDVNGDVEDLLNTPITFAEEVSEDQPESSSGEVTVWTFYKLGTNKGTVTLRWIGSSNGYYSTDVRINEAPLLKSGEKEE